LAYRNPGKDQTRFKPPGFFGDSGPNRFCFKSVLLQIGSFNLLLQTSLLVLG
jgi:hypothetical protein